MATHLICSAGIIDTRSIALTMQNGCNEHFGVYTSKVDEVPWLMFITTQKSSTLGTYGCDYIILELQFIKTRNLNFVLK